jgi:hypothetical protein
MKAHCGGGEQFVKEVKSLASESQAQDNHQNKNNATLLIVHLKSLLEHDKICQDKLYPL